MIHGKFAEIFPHESANSLYKRYHTNERIPSDDTHY